MAYRENMGKSAEHNTTANLKIVTSMLIFGTIGLVRRNIPYSSTMIAFFRGAIAAIILLVLKLIRRQSLDEHSFDETEKTAIKRNILPLAISGAMIGINWILLFEAYRFTTIAVATISYYMAPVFTIIASIFLLKEKLTARKAICVAAALTGMVFVSGVLETGISGIKGVLLGLGAALLYSGVVILNKKIDGVDGIDRTIIQMGAAAIAVLPYWLINEDFSSIIISTEPVLLLLTAAVICTALPYSLYFSAIQKVPAQTAAILSYIDPVVAVLISALLLKEGMSLLTLTGVVLVMGAAMISETS
ncbi:MAG: EamA family transporter [Spirochaetales bacterium]|nr:EamA family transporter [Spirochaetales bacterium]